MPVSCAAGEQDGDVVAPDQLRESHPSSSGGGTGSSYSTLKSCSSCAAAASPPELPVTVSTMLTSLP